MMMTAKKTLFWLAPFVIVLCMSLVESAEWKASEKVCLHMKHHGRKRLYTDVDFEGCKAACEAERNYNCRAVLYDVKIKECYGEEDVKGCYDSSRWESGDCKLHWLENGYHTLEFAEIKRKHTACTDGTDFECPCTISRGYDAGSRMYGGYPQCQRKNAVCDGWNDCWGRNKDDELLSNCPQTVIEQLEEGNGDCIDPLNGGADYRGNISVTAKGEKCMDWYEAKPWIKKEFVDKTAKNVQEYLNHESFQGEHNYCRNMLLSWHAVKLQPSPVCYVKGVGSPVQVPCSIPTCSKPNEFQFSRSIRGYYEWSMKEIIENSESDYNYFIQTEGCEMSLDDWWKNIAGCNKFNPHDTFGLCPYGICEQDSGWHKCIRSSCKLPKLKTRKDIVNLVRTRYETCSICSSSCSSSRIQQCVESETKEDLATPNGKWAQCINGIYNARSTRCKIPKYWSFPGIEE